MILTEDELAINNYKLQEKVLPKGTIRRPPPTPHKIPEGLASQELKMIEQSKTHH